MYLYNTLSGKKEKLAKPKNRALKLFVCGPTVYDHSHIGHARTYLVFDIFVRYLRSLGIKVFYLQNITDIDDKIIDRAKKEKKKPLELSRSFEKEYYRDMKALGINTVNRYARASGFIKEIKNQIGVLIKKGFAYQTRNGIYFEIKKFKDYGKLSRQKLNEVRHGWRIEPDPQKKDPLDFALWKGPWGAGRPGWHIEDTAISEKFFGPQYDLHGGAIDLKFPHHESEIAQQESASGKKPFVKIWMHTGFLLVKGEKMSKSLGNFITIRDFLKKFPPEVLRMIILTHHYRSPINYTERLAADAQKNLQTIAEFLNNLTVVQKNKKAERIDGVDMVKYEIKFKEALADDFNTPKALAATFELINSFRKNIMVLSQNEARALSDFLQRKFKIFGLTFKKEKTPAQIKSLIKEREKLRLSGNFQEADRLRKKLQALGYSIEDTVVGPLIKPIKR